jgi:hypothetical protein
MKKLTMLTVWVVAAALVAPAVQADPRPDAKGDDVCRPYCHFIDGWIAFATSLFGKAGAAGDGRDQRPGTDVAGDRPGRHQNDRVIRSEKASDEEDPVCLGCPGLPTPKDDPS